MKKTILSSVLLLAVVALAPAAMAATSIIGATTLGSATNSFTPSTKVGLSVISTQTAYAASSCHVNGTFQYGTVGGTGSAQDASKIYQADIPTGQSGDYGKPTDPASATALGSVTWK
jgi:hypothetical protein